MATLCAIVWAVLLVQLTNGAAVTYTVNPDGSADYTTLQAAIDAAPKNSVDKITIELAAGTYREIISVASNKVNITVTGTGPDETVVVYNNYADTEKPDGSGTYGTSGSATVTLKGADFTAINLTFSNDFDESSTTDSNKQAVAVKTSGDRIVFNNVNFIGNQDTLYADSGSNTTISRVYFYNCYIEGDVDFIFGRATAVFDRVRIHALNRDLTPSGYLTAPSTWIENPYGFLIFNSTITSDAADKTGYLGRPWHPSGNVNSVGMTIIRDTELPASIMDTAWSDMSGFTWEDARFYEYNNTGSGAVINDNRPQLTEEQATVYTPENFLAGSDNWNPIVV